MHLEMTLKLGDIALLGLMLVLAVHAPVLAILACAVAGFWSVFVEKSNDKIKAADAADAGK